MKPGSTHQTLVTAALLIISLGFVTCSKGPTDDEITKSIQSAYYADPQVRNDQINVSVKNGEVTLSGTVATDADHTQAYKLADQAAGVKKINDQLQVNAAQAVPSQPTAPPRPEETRTASREKKSAPEASAPSPAPVAEAEQAAPAPPAPPPPPPPPQPTPVTVPAGADVRVRTIDAISSKTGQPGQTYQASLAAPIVVEDMVVVPKGATVFLQVAGAKQAGKIKGSSTNLRNSALPGKFVRSSARAAGIPNPSAIVTAANATKRLFSTDSQIASSANNVRYQSSVKLRGGNPPTPAPLNE